MKMPRSVRILFAMAVIVLGLAALLLLLTISESMLTIRAHLATSEPWLAAAWWGLAGALALLVTWLVWRILRGDDSAARPPAERDVEPPDEARIERDLERATELGADTAVVRAELAELARRRESGEIHIVLFGEISTGKSSLINALIWVESKFERKAKGPAGAQGLMQLMPKTAQAMAKLLGRKRNSYDPDFNIHAGTLLLSRLLARFDGDVGLALAGYNRGGGTVSKWIAAEQEFPEGVQTFVARVLEAQAWFQQLPLELEADAGQDR